MATTSHPTLLHPPLQPARPSFSHSPQSATSVRPQLHLSIESGPSSPNPNSPATSWSPSTGSHQGELVFSPSNEPTLDQAFSSTGHDSHKHSSTRGSQARPVPSEIFHQLDQIKILHTQIAGEHAKMERVGPGAGPGAVGDAEAEGERDKDKSKGSRDDSKSESAKKNKGEAYEKMAHEFEQRKAGVEHVMAKVSASRTTNLHLATVTSAHFAQSGSYLCCPTRSKSFTRSHHQ